jgi:pimeloyl-ACP methyl ester carboxylesterase
VFTHDGRANTPGRVISGTPPLARARRRAPGSGELLAVLPGTSFWSGSPAPVLPYHLATMALLPSGILDQLGYQQADVLGISRGGGLAQQFALRCPARVRRLVLVATAPGALMVPGFPPGIHPLPGAAHDEPDRPRRSSAALRRVRADGAAGRAAAGPSGN